MSSLGDIIHALPSLYALRKAYPEARITWAVHPAFAGILPGKPWIDEVYLVDRKRIKPAERKRSATTMAEKAASSSASRFPDPTSTDTLSNSF